MKPASRAVMVCPIGRVAFQPTWALQECIKDRLVAAKRSGQIEPHVMLLLEHPPVYTLGKSGNVQHMRGQTGPRGAEFFRIDRGGDVTWHGPGQLVVYFLLDLDRFYRDLHRFMRDLEEVIIRLLADYGLSGFRVPGRTGVWTGAQGSEKKICAFGIRTSRWVTMHGLALNVDPDLSYFDHIVPCGIADRGVTSLSQELQCTIDPEQVHMPLVRHFEGVLGAQTQVFEPDAAYLYLESVSGQAELQTRLAPTAPSTMES